MTSVRVTVSVTDLRSLMLSKPLKGRGGYGDRKRVRKRDFQNQRQTDVSRSTRLESKKRFVSSKDTKAPSQWPFGGHWLRGGEQETNRYHSNYFFKNLTYGKDKERLTTFG